MIENKTENQKKESRIKSPWFLYFMCLNAATGFFYFGFNQGVFNVCQLIILQLKGYDLNDDETETERNTYKAMMTGANPLGGLIGALIGTYVLKWMGSLKKSFFAIDLLGIIGTVVIICNLDFWNIILGRFLQGLSAGFSSSLVPLYIKEFSPLEISGKTGSFPQLGQKGGLLISYLTGLALPSKHELLDGDEQDYDNNVVWRVILAVPILFCLCRTICLLIFFRFDSPSEELKDNQEQQLLKFLEIVYKEQHVKDAFSQALQRYNDFVRIQQDDDEDEDKKHTQGDKVTQKLKIGDDDDDNNVKQQQQNNVNTRSNLIAKTENVEIGIKRPHTMNFDEEGDEILAELTEAQLEQEEAEFEALEKETRVRRNMLGMCISLAVSLSGIDAIFFYSNKIFEDAGEQELATYFTIGIGVISLLFSFIGMAMADTTGRKPLLLGGSIIMTLSIGLLVIGDIADQVSLVITSIVIFMFGYNSTFGPVKWPAWVELMNSQWSSIAASSIFVWAFIIGVGFPYLVEGVNLWGAFLIFFGLSALCFFYLLIELKETKGKNQRQIYKLYSRTQKDVSKKPPKFSTNEHILELQGMSAFGLRAIGDKKRLDMASIHKSFHKSMKSLHGQSINKISIHGFQK